MYISLSADVLMHIPQLFVEYDLETPVAHWASPDESSPLSLMLYPGTENFHPQIILAFTVRELKMRMTEKADTVAQSRSAAQSSTLVSLGAHEIIFSCDLYLLYGTRMA
jgi:hypothetical protein